MNWETVICQYIDHLTYVERKAKLTQQSYRSDLKQFQCYFEEKGIAFDDVDTTTLNAMIIAMSSEKSNASILRMISSIKGLYGFVSRIDETHADPTVNMVSVSKRKRIPKIVPTSEVNDLLISDVNSHMGLDLALIDLLYSCGLRVSELTTLKLNQVFLDDGYLRIIGK